MTPKPYHCRHLFTDGHQCGSPALHGEPLCYYHHAARRPDQLRTVAGDARIALPEPADLHAVQRGLCELLRLAATRTVDDQCARTLLRILATASSNLARIDRQTAAAHKADPNRTPVQDYILDPQRGTIAPAPLVASDQPSQHAQPAEPAPRPEGPLPDPVTRLTLKPVIELVRDPNQQAFEQELNTLRWEKSVRELEAANAAQAAANAALTPTQREAQRQAHRNRLPPDYRQIFDELQAEQQAAQRTAAPATDPQPQPNQDFGLFENTHETQLAHA